MSKEIYKKSEIDNIKKTVDYLVNISGCTREMAVIKLCTAGLIQGTFKSQDISSILQVPYKIIINNIKIAEYKINEVSKKVFAQEFKEALIDIDGRNFSICSMNL